jgi:hypothetical protein
MKFPLLCISIDRWIIDDLLEYLDFDGFFYTSDKELFDRYANGKFYCDCKGMIYIVEGKVPPESWWRNTFKFIPNVYREKIIYRSIGKKIELEELRAYVIQKVTEMEHNEFKAQWMVSLQKAKSYQEIITAI